MNVFHIPRSGMSNYARIFGSGPIGLICSLSLLGFAIWLRGFFPSSSLGLSAPLRYFLLGAASMLTLIGIIWSFRSLPPDRRGRRLCVQGAFRWVRHPLYASFLSVFVPAFAFFLNHWIFLLWAFLLHPLWHVVVRYEEHLMESHFGHEFVEYARRTGRFFPRLYNGG